MWENSVERRLIRNVVAAILCIAALGTLLFVMRKVNAEREKEVQSLVEVSSQKQVEQEQLISATYRSMEEDYQKDMSTLAEYVPGIVCWGDTLTRGTPGNMSYPDVLGSYVHKNLIDNYHFTSSYDGSVVYSGIDASRYKADIPVINMGGGDENAATILCRAGTDFFVLGRDVMIPAEREPIRITLMSASGSTVNPLTVGDQGLNPVTIDGIEGTIALVSANRRSSAYYAFTRAEEGEEHIAAKGTEIRCSNRDIYTDYIHVIWLGSYDTAYTVDQYLERCENLLSRQTKNPERFLIIGPCTYNRRWDRTDIRNILDEVDSAMMARYGGRYVSLRQYLMTDGPLDANITLSRDDTNAVKGGAVPVCFRSGDGSVELTGKAYELLGRLAFERMYRLGYFSEIIDELKIDYPKTEQ